MRRIGNEDSHALRVASSCCRAGRAAAGDRAGGAHARRHRAQRHRGGRDRGEADAPRDRPADRDRLPSAATTASRRDRRRSAPSRARSARGLARARCPGFVHVPYPNPYRTPFREPRPGGSGDATVDYIRDHLLFHAVDPAQVAGRRDRAGARLGRVRRAARRVLAGARPSSARSYGWLLCADEVKTGFGRGGDACSRSSAGASSRT